MPTTTKVSFEQYRPVYKKYSNRKITAIEAAAELGININTFYYYRKKFGEEHGYEQLPTPAPPKDLVMRRAEDKDLATRWNLMRDGVFTRKEFCRGKSWRALRERIAVLRVRHPKWGIKYLDPERDSFENDTGRVQRTVCIDRITVTEWMLRRDPGFYVDILGLSPGQWI